MMGTFSPWFSGTPSYSTYADIGGGSLLSNRPSIKEVQKNQSSTDMVTMPKNTTVVNQTVQRPQQRRQDNTLNNINGLAKMAKSFMDAPTDITGTGPSTPGYSLGMDLSGEQAIIDADLAEAGIPTITPAASEGIAAKSTVNALVGAVPEVTATPMQLTGAGMAGVVGGKMGKYFGEWAGHELGMGGKREQDIIGGTLGGAAAGAMYGSVVPGVGTITGGLIGEAAGGIGNLFSIF